MNKITKKAFLILFALLFIGAIVILVLVLRKNKDSMVEYDEKTISLEDISNTENYELKPNDDKKITVFDMEKDDIYAFSFTDANSTQLSFHLNESEWIFDEDISIDLNDEYVDSLISELSTIRCNEILTNRDVNDLNFQEPDLIYTLSDATGTSTIISISTKYANEDKYYFVINDNYDVVYLNDSSLVEISKNTLSTMDVE